MKERTTGKKLSEEEKTAFGELIRRIQLRYVQVSCAHLKTDRKFVTERIHEAATIEVGLEVNCGAELAEGGRLLVCDVVFLLKCFVDGEKEPVAEIGETYIVSYAVEGSEPVEEKTLQFFAENNATFNVWPFFRASVHATTMRLGMPGYALPLLKPAPERK